MSGTGPFGATEDPSTPAASVRDDGLDGSQFLSRMKLTDCHPERSRGILVAAIAAGARHRAQRFPFLACSWLERKEEGA
jgi:hypothetical protein